VRVRARARAQVFEHPWQRELDPNEADGSVLSDGVVGRPYFYNSLTGEATRERPRVLGGVLATMRRWGGGGPRTSSRGRRLSGEGRLRGRAGGRAVVTRRSPSSSRGAAGIVSVSVTTAPNPGPGLPTAPC
jgi:hypothetical protein